MLSPLDLFEPLSEESAGRPVRPLRIDHRRSRRLGGNAMGLLPLLEGLGSTLILPQSL